MRLGIFGKKVGMTQIFNEAGATVPVTVVDTTDCVVTQVKTKQTDGYNALQVGYGNRKPQNVLKAQTGHYKKASTPAKAHLKEIKFSAAEDLSQFAAGKKLAVTMFAKGDIVDVTGTSKGKGFTGVVKRYGWHGADATHGASKYYRHGGSNGTNTFPGRVLKNKGNPGQTGNAKSTTHNLKVVDVLPEQNLILIQGAVPGPRNGYLMIRSAKKKSLPTGRNWLQA